MDVSRAKSIFRYNSKLILFALETSISLKVNIEL